MLFIRRRLGWLRGRNPHRLGAVSFVFLPLRKRRGGELGGARIRFGHLFYRKRLRRRRQRGRGDGRRDSRDIILRGGWKPGSGRFGVPCARRRIRTGLRFYPFAAEVITALLGLGSLFWRAGGSFFVERSNFREPGRRIRRCSFRDFNRLGGFAFLFNRFSLGW